MFLRAQFNYDQDAASDEAGLLCEDKSLAQQHQKDEADINTIVRRFGLTGELPSGIRMPTYGDFTVVTDYQTALNAVKAAEASFMAMPAHIRMKFDNSPEKFVDFCSNPANLEAAIELGLAVKKETGEAGAGTPATDTTVPPAQPASNSAPATGA